MRLERWTLLGALLLNVLLAWVAIRRHRYGKLVELQLIEARFLQLRDLWAKLERVQERHASAQPPPRDPSDAAHLVRLTQETGLSETELREHLAKMGKTPEEVDVIRLPRNLVESPLPGGMIEALLRGKSPDVCPNCKKTHPPFGSEATETTEGIPPGSDVS